jgi:PAS domain S-box-containing protein
MAIKRSELKTELQKAIQRAEVIPYFQPLVEIRSGVLSGFEVLARWPHSHRGTVHPDEFIPIAEEAGLIGELTQTILLQAFAATAALKRNLHLSVNISPIQLRDHSLPEQIRRAAIEGNFPLDHLTVEITESALVDNLELAGSIATELKRLGVKLALDDFGTGYSSLRNLQALPFDELKVDRSFVSSMIQNRDSRKIVAAVIGLGQSLKLTTVAEGIENSTQADILRWLGCDLGQGWLYGPPVSVQDLPNVISTPMPAAIRPVYGSPASDLVSCMEPLPSQRLAQLQAIYDGAPVGLAFVDTDLRYVSINQRLAALSGIPVEDHLGRKLSDVIPPTAYSQIGPHLLRALNGEAVTGLEVTKSVHGGQLGTFLVSHQPARDEAEEVIGVSIAVVDITERKQMENALRESKDHYRHMVELNSQMLWIMDPDGSLVEASRNWTKFSGQTEEQTLNSGWKAAMHPDDLEQTLPIFHACLQSGDPIDVQHRVRTANNQLRWMRSRAKPLRDNDGQILRWYGSTDDIDDYMKLKQTLQETEAKLIALLQ